MNAAVRFGVDRACDDPPLLARAAGVARLARVGLVTNEAARLASAPARRSRVALREAGIPIERLFSPEHGLNAVGEDGAPMHDGVDAVTGLPIVSLYGARFAPPDETLADLDAILFDIPDVGARFYTYMWTLSHVLESCARTGTPLVILDRPNPLGGALADAEGPILDEATCASFIGRWAVPVRHSLTLGEMARWWRATRIPRASDVQVGVVTCEGWGRAMRWPALGVPWVPTSPAMPSFDSARLYPGLCLFEGTNLSVGRGTATPFQQVAAPWLDPTRVVASLAGALPDGVRLSGDRITPSQGLYAGVPSPAVRVQVGDDAALRPVALALQLLAAVARSHRGAFAWSVYPTAANPGGGDHFARLVGTRHLAAALEDPTVTLTPAQIAEWTSAGDWGNAVASSLLYR